MLKKNKKTISNYNKIIIIILNIKLKLKLKKKLLIIIIIILPMQIKFKTPVFNLKITIYRPSHKKKTKNPLIKKSHIINNKIMIQIIRIINLIYLNHKHKPIIINNNNNNRNSLQGQAGAAEVVE